MLRERRTKAQWHTTCFEFSTWKGREVPCVLVGSKVTEIQESLEAQDRSDGVRCGHNFKVLMWYNVWLNKNIIDWSMIVFQWWSFCFRPTQNWMLKEQRIFCTKGSISDPGVSQWRFGGDTDDFERHERQGLRGWGLWNFSWTGEPEIFRYLQHSVGEWQVILQIA